MKFTAKGRQYQIDRNWVISQTDAKPYKYDPEYSAIYDGPEYKRDSDELMKHRLEWVHKIYGSFNPGCAIHSIFDIGYGNGAFLNYVRDNAPYIIRLGHDITGVSLNGSCTMPGYVSASVYTMWDVLEHMPDTSFLNKLPTEYIFISLPYCHYFSEGKDWFENEYPHLKPDEHIRHFDDWSLISFMSDHGWILIASSDHEDKIRKSKHGLQNILSMAFKRK